MVNKRGFLRVVEATIAVMIILTGLIFLSSQRSVPQTVDVASEVPSLLEELARNLSFREKVARETGGGEVAREVKTFLSEKINNPTLNFEVNVCNMTEVCFLQPYPDVEGDIFSSERIISGSIKNESFAPKKLKVFIWREES